MTYHFLAMDASRFARPYTRLVTKPQNLSISAKKTVETMVVTMTTTVPLVTSVRLGQVTFDISAATSSASSRARVRYQ